MTSRPLFHSLAILIISSPSLLLAITDATWLGGDWNNNANWSYNLPPDVFPNGIDTTARFTELSPSGTALLNQTITVGHIEQSDASVVIGNFEGDILNFSVSSGTATLNVTGGTFYMPSAGDVNLLSPLTISNTGGGLVEFDAQFQGSENLTIAAGAVTYVPLLVTAVTGDLILGNSASFTVDGSLAIPTFGGLSGSGQLTAGARFLINAADHSSTFGGTIILPMGGIFGKTGAETLTITGTNSSGNFAGFSVNGGTLSVSSLENLGDQSITFFSSLYPSLGSATLHVTGSSPFTFPGTVLTPGFVGGATEFNIDSTTALTLSGTWTGVAGTVNKTGGGELILSGAKTFTIPMTVSAGTLTVSGSIATNTTVNGGIFAVSGSTSGTTTVNNGGIFSITGTTSALTTVNSGGRVRGTGTLQSATVNSGGIIAPGNSIGTLNVGTLTLNAGSITQIEISPTASSQIIASGFATLGGTVNVVQQSGTYGTSGSYPILVGNGGTSGFFDETVTGGLPGFIFSLDFSPATNSVLLLYSFSGIPTTNLTGSADKFARYLNQYAPTSAATQALLSLPADDLQDALESANPSRNAFAPFAAQDTMFGWSNLLAGHLVDQRFYHAQQYENSSVASLFNEERDLLTADASGRMVLPRTCDTHSFWIGTLGEYAHQDAIDQNPAFHYYSGGGMLGVDFYGENNLFGLGGGASYTHLIEDNDAGNLNITSYFFTLYDTIYGPCNFPVYYEIGAWGVYNQIHNYRYISFPGTDLTARSSFHSWQLVPHLGLGYHADYGCFSFDPFVQFDLAVDWQQGFQEKGAGAFNMTETARTSQFLRSEGGFRFYQVRETCWGSWMVMEKLSYVNKKTFGTGEVSAAIVGTSALFSVETFGTTQNLGSGGIEFLCRWGDRKPITLSITYNGEFGSRYMSQEGMIRFIKDF